MFNNTDPYALRKEIAKGITRYFVSFVDGQDHLRDVEISREVYVVIDECRRHEKRQRNFFDRYIEHSQLTDESLSRRAFAPASSIEEALTSNEERDALYAALNGLSEVQRRRFILYHAVGFSLEQIAGVEGCSISSVSRAVLRAEQKIRKFMKNF
jgi:RNA polymerase sigma-70 factor (ECF subfamily)